MPVISVSVQPYQLQAPFPAVLFYFAISFTMVQNTTTEAMLHAIPQANWNSQNRQEKLLIMSIIVFLLRAYPAIYAPPLSFFVQH